MFSHAQVQSASTFPGKDEDFVCLYLFSATYVACYRSNAFTHTNLLVNRPTLTLYFFVGKSKIYSKKLNTDNLFSFNLGVFSLFRN